MSHDDLMEMRTGAGLTIVMPIGNLKNDFDNVLRVTKACNEYLIKLVLVLDDQPLEIEKMLIKKIEQNTWDSVMVTSGIWRNPGSARNYGLRFCSTDWVGFWDSDDSPNFEGVSRLLTELESGQFDVGIGEFQIRDINGLLNENLRSDSDSIASLELRVISNPGIWRFIFHRNFVDGVSFGEYSSAEDQLFLQRIFARLPRIRVSREKVYTYVKGGKFQLTRSEKIAQQTLAVLKLGVEEISNIPKEFSRIRIGLIFKQIVSVVKYGDFFESLTAIKMLWKLLIRVGVRELISAIFLFYRTLKKEVYFGRT